MLTGRVMDIRWRTRNEPGHASSPLPTAAGAGSDHSPDAVLQQLVLEARDPHWSPLASARRLSGYADSDLQLLRASRAGLGTATDAEPRSVRTRALATLTIAIADLEDRAGGRERKDPTVP